jgi:hypothetical protein
VWFAVTTAQQKFDYPLQRLVHEPTVYKFEGYPEIA